MDCLGRPPPPPRPLPVLVLHWTVDRELEPMEAESEGEKTGAGCMEVSAHGSGLAIWGGAARGWCGATSKDWAQSTQLVHGSQGDIPVRAPSWLRLLWGALGGFCLYKGTRRGRHVGVATVNPSGPSETSPTAPFTESEEPCPGLGAGAPSEAEASPLQGGGHLQQLLLSCSHLTPSSAAPGGRRHRQTPLVPIVRARCRSRKQCSFDGTLQRQGQVAGSDASYPWPGPHCSLPTPPMSLRSQP